jgi:amidohydrolase
MKRVLLIIFFCISLASFAQNSSLRDAVSKKSDAIEGKVISWRRDFHANPELGNSEVRTASIIAKHLEDLGITVTKGVAKTGVVGVLKGDKPGPVVALRADMDALPITENGNVPFISKVKTQYNGQQVGVMHACGHDSHVAILMGVAEVLVSMKKDIKGTVKFIFQPAEEGAPVGEQGGAELMVKEGVLENPKVDAIFGLHINSQTEVGNVTYKPGGTMASVNDLKITVIGKTSHGGYPWTSVDPIVISAQIITNLQTIVSRNLNLTENPGVITIGAINGGVRTNIIPEKVEMLGTVRNFTKEDEALFIDRIKTIATKTAEAGGATAEVKIPYSSHYPVTYNDPDLTEKMLPSMKATAGANHVKLKTPVTGAEDFSFFQEKVPGLFVFLGGMAKGADPRKVGPHHTPDFYLDESGFKLGVKLLSNLALDYLELK